MNRNKITVFARDNFVGCPKLLLPSTIVQVIFTHAVAPSALGCTAGSFRAKTIGSTGNRHCWKFAAERQGAARIRFGRREAVHQDGAAGEFRLARFSDRA